MNAPHHPIQTAADILAMLEQADLSPVRRRDMASSINRVCTMIGCAPAALRLDVEELRVKIAAIRPAAHGISATTSSNLRSLLATALKWAGLLDSIEPGAARRDPIWTPLVEAISGDKRLSSGLATFMNWCAHRGIPPADVDDYAMHAFLNWLETRTLKPRSRQLVRETARIWTEAQARVPGWPAQRVSPVRFRPVSTNLTWEELPATLRKEAEAYLALRSKPDVFDADPAAPKRALASSTIRQQREHIRLAVSVLVRSGTPVEELRGLADLVTVNAFKAVIRHYHEQAGRKPNAFVVVLAKTLIDVARYSARLPEEHLNELKRLASKLPSVPFDLSHKNKRFLREMEGEHMRARLLFLPEDLMRWVKMELQQGRLRFVEAQIAVAVATLLAAPLRPENLIELNVSRHLREPQGGRGKLVIHIAKDETKTRKRDLTFELPAELAEPIRWYCREILARLEADPRGDLFVSPGGKRKSQETLSQQLTEIIGEWIGIHMTPHQFRHLAAVAYLEEHPEDFQSVTDLLGHAWAKTTSIYAGSSTRRASRVYGEHVLEQWRQLQLRRPRRKGSKGARKLE